MSKRAGYRAAAAVLLGMATQLTACGGLEALNAVSPSDGYKKTGGVAYGSHERQRLDVYVPAQLRAEAPLVVFFYGGGWRDGSRAQYEFVASSLTAQGMIVVIPDYRLYPEVVFPAFVEDAGAAAAWALNNAPKFGADPDEIYVMGHSAGAHLAALLVTDDRYLAAHGRGPGDFAGLIGLSGPYDFLPIESGYLLDVFPENSREQSQPIRFASDAVPRTLLIHGSSDSKVQPGNSRRFAEVLREEGVDVTLEIYSGTGHGRVVATLAPPLDFLANTLDDCVAFIRNLPAAEVSALVTATIRWRH